jgi:hypothetical protein
MNSQITLIAGEVSGVKLASAKINSEDFLL